MESIHKIMKNNDDQIIYGYGWDSPGLDKFNEFDDYGGYGFWCNKACAKRKDAKKAAKLEAEIAKQAAKTEIKLAKAQAIAAGAPTGFQSLVGGLSSIFGSGQPPSPTYQPPPPPIPPPAQAGLFGGLPGWVVLVALGLLALALLPTLLGKRKG